MTVIGFQFRHKCPADVDIPHYLFFGGICGLIAISMRILMIVTWYYINHVHSSKDDEDDENNEDHSKNDKILHYDKGYVFLI